MTWITASANVVDWIDNARDAKTVGQAEAVAAFLLRALGELHVLGDKWNRAAGTNRSRETRHSEPSLAVRKPDRHQRSNQSDSPDQIYRNQ